MMRAFAALVLVTVSSAVLIAAGPAGISSFLGAPAGTPAAFQPVALPTVTPNFVFDGTGPFAPSTAELLRGDHVITSDAQMRHVWGLLFATPYDPTRFDFSRDFVVLMGRGQLQGGSFAISSVERVDASWSSFLVTGGESDAFLAVTATTVLPGILPYPPLPAVWRVSAVRIPRTLQDDVVFHRTTLAAP